MQLDTFIKDDPETINAPGFWQRLGNVLEEKNTEEYLSFAINELLNHGDLVFLTAFGPEGCVLIDLLAKALKDLPEERIISSLEEYESHIEVQKSLIEKDLDARLASVKKRSLLGANEHFEHERNAAARTFQTSSQGGKFILANLDTEFQFKETLELKDKLEAKYNLPILLIKPDITIPEQEKQYGERLFETDPDQCCYMRKIKPLNKLLENKLAWITSIRREQTDVRAKAMSFEFDNKFKLGKINPLTKWSKSDIWQFIHENKVPYNPLLDQGYDSIGCEPCTKPGIDRQGRWAGKDKIECGLHLQDTDMDQGGEFVI